MGAALHRQRPFHAEYVGQAKIREQLEIFIGAARMRDEAPVYRNDERNFWALSRYDDVMAGFRDSERFSNAQGVSIDPAASGPNAHRTMSFLAMDPPEHGRMRGLVSRGFTPRRVAAMEDNIRALTVGHLESCLDAGSFDFVTDLALPHCIASSSEPPWIEAGLGQFDLIGTFNGAIYSAAVHVSRGKPHPDIYLHAAAAMGARPDKALVIEDTVTGVRAGVAAGTTVIGLCAGGHIRPGHAKRLLDAGAHHIVDTYAEVARIAGHGPTA